MTMVDHQAMVSVVQGRLSRVSGEPTPENTVLPAITGTATIGEELTASTGTWTPEPTSYAYQWKRDGVAIDGATSSAYTLVDADFGRAITVTVTATNDGGSTAATSEATELVAETPVQAIGNELVTNPDLNWNPTLSGWGVVHGGSFNADPGIFEVAPDGSSGTGAARFLASSTGTAAMRCAYTGGLEGWAEEVTEISAYVSGGLQTEIGLNTNPSPARTQTGTFRRLVNATVSNGEVQSVGSYPHDIVLNRYSVKPVALNGQLTAPSADMRLDLFFTLPETPVEGTQIWLMPRISDFSAGNYWLALLIYTSAQWNINLYAVTSHTHGSALISASNVGATNGVRVLLYEDSISLFTTDDGGGSWTQRGATIASSTYQSATGVNAMSTSDVTLDVLEYAYPN